MPEPPASLHAALVDHLRAIGLLTQPAVEAAFRAIPRQLFLPDLPAEEVYRDDAIPTKMADGHAISSSSQPAMMAIMLEQLDLLPGQRVLEIGAGTGYNAALLGQLVSPGGQVVTVDIDEDIVAAARAHLAAAGSANVQVVCADGGAGYAPAAPYDRIILSVSAWDITPAWYDQLAPGGRLVLPLRVASGAQKSVAFNRAPNGVEPRFISRSMADCGFMNLRGAFAGTEYVTNLGQDTGSFIVTAAPLPAPAETIEHWLHRPLEQPASGPQTTVPEVFGSLGLWLELQTPDVFVLSLAGAPHANRPCLIQFHGPRLACLSVGLIQAEGMALLDRGPRAAPETAFDDQTTFELAVVGYGPAGTVISQDLLGLLARWDQAGRPPSARLRLRVYGPDDRHLLAPGEVRIQKRWTTLVVDWGGVAHQ